MLRADQADGHLDGNIEGKDYSEFIGGIDLSLRSEGENVNGNDLSEENTNVACFRQGTLIRAQNGAVPIENLKPGDLVWTQDDGLQPVSWIGSQELTGEELRKNPNVRPIRIKKGALKLEFLFPMLFEKSFMPKLVRPFISGKEGVKLCAVT